ncbi:hypothetical protein YC94_004742 [Salmonella enterica subsp. diarizonae]|nr:hypothetical protein [Salmonella enterica subsp. diarizonae]
MAIFCQHHSDYSLYHHSSHTATGASNAAGQVMRLDGDPLQVAQWSQACRYTGIGIRIQINESSGPEKGGQKQTE